MNDPRKSRIGEKYDGPLFAVETDSKPRQETPANARHRSFWAALFAPFMPPSQDEQEEFSRYQP